MKILYIINPAAGGADHSETIESIKKLSHENQIHPRFYFTDGDQDEKKIRKHLDDFKPDRVAAGGGDGTIQLVARLVLGMNIPIGIIPLGSANGLATAMALPKDPVEATKKILESGCLKPFDMLKFNNKHIGIHVADIGVNALIVKKYKEEGLRGMLGYARNLLSAIKESPLLQCTIHTPKETLRKEGYMLAFANADRYGTGVRISNGSVSDGRFEICNVERIALDNAIQAGLSMLNVFDDKVMFSDIISCRSAEITVDQKIHFQIDGEYQGTTNHLQIEILPSAVQLIK